VPSNEQSVVQQRQRVAELQRAYRDAIASFLTVKEAALTGSEAERQLATIHGLARDYFSAQEEFVGDSSLLGARSDDEWALGFAEDCYAVLLAVVAHYKFIQATCNRYSLPYERYVPVATAYAGMQRTVRKYLPDYVPTLLSDFNALAIPSRGLAATEGEASTAPDVGSDGQDGKGATGATVEFGPHGVTRATGLNSQDALAMVTGIVSKGMDGYSAPASASSAADLLRGGLDVPETTHEVGWLVRQWHKMRDSPMDIAVRVAGGLLTAAILAALAYFGLSLK